MTDQQFEDVLNEVKQSFPLCFPTSVFVCVYYSSCGYIMLFIQLYCGDLSAYRDKTQVPIT